MRPGFQPRGKLLLELCNLGTDDKLTVALEGISNKLLLMVGFSLVPLRSRHNLSNDGSRIQLFPFQLLDQCASYLALNRRVIKDRRAVLCPNIVPLTITRGGIVDQEKDFKQLTVRDDCGSKVTRTASA